MIQIDKELLIKDLEKNEQYKELLLEVLSGKYDSKNYKAMCKSLIGQEINNFYCNGFFGRTYDLSGAEIISILETEDDDIKLTVLKTNEEYAYAYFDEGWNSWEIVYKQINEWIDDNE